MHKILISDHLSDGWQAVFEDHHAFQVDVRTGLDEEALCGILPDYAGLIVRSATKVTENVIQAGVNLKAIGRAGAGVDNIDLDAATARGIVVMNAPGGNTISTAEHAMALLLALARNIPQASGSVKSGKWDRSAYTGVELDGKVLGIIGVGRIGQQVARRARAFGMKILGADPFLSEDLARKLDIEPISMEGLFAQADYITLHAASTDHTRHILSADSLARCKRGVRIVNCARGELVDETALLKAIESGVVAGAALDVFQREPPEKNNPLLHRPEVICTPHLGASTFEAQEKVARQIAANLRDSLLGKPVPSALNLPSMDPEHYEAIRPYLLLAEKVGSLHAQLMGGQLRRLVTRYQGAIRDYATEPLTAAVLKGAVGQISDEHITQVNARIWAENQGIKVEESKSSNQHDYNNLITVDIETSLEMTSISATSFGRRDPRLVRIDDFEVKAKLEGHMLFCCNHDVPGVVGHLGSLFAENNINIADMALGRKTRGGQAIMVFNIDAPVSEHVLNQIASKDFVYWVKQVEL